MRLESLDCLGISFWRIALLGTTVSTSVMAVVGLIAWGVLGVAKIPLVLMAGSGTFYVVLSTPRRMLDRQRLSQARDSVTLAAAMKATMGIVGSRCRTLALIRPGEESLAIAAREARRMVLLGNSLRRSVDSSTRKVVSYSAMAALKSLATLGGESMDSGDDEARGLSASSDLNTETKIPMYMTVCFFSPIMLILYSVFGGLRDPFSLASLVALEFVILDLAFFLTSTDRGVH